MPNILFSSAAVRAAPLSGEWCKDHCSPNEVWEMDIKYFWISGEERNAYFLSFIDCFTKEAMMRAFHERGTGSIGNVRIRDDSGMQPV